MTSRRFDSSRWGTWAARPAPLLSPWACVSVCSVRRGGLGVTGHVAKGRSLGISPHYLHPPTAHHTDQYSPPLLSPVPVRPGQPGPSLLHTPPWAGSSSSKGGALFPAREGLVRPGKEG